MHQHSFDEQFFLVLLSFSTILLSKFFTFSDWQLAKQIM